MPSETEATVGGLKARVEHVPECRTRGCERDADGAIPPSTAACLRALREDTEAPPRYFCKPCYLAWSSGARTMFRNGVPKLGPVEVNADDIVEDLVEE